MDFGDEIVITRLSKYYNQFFGYIGVLVARSTRSDGEVKYCIEWPDGRQYYHFGYELNLYRAKSKIINTYKIY